MHRFVEGPRRKGKDSAEEHTLLMATEVKGCEATIADGEFFGG